MQRVVKNDTKLRVVRATFNMVQRAEEGDINVKRAVEYNHRAMLRTGTSIYLREPARTLSSRLY
uniref:Uncharacterized protein n=1 Tax=Utricularia reniformis TaxID=192314 RepID=A0A1Y0B0X3_9LAMI|nr:hypothetical protein AEK19_MT0798 [Utricularia reniformis]ART31037.1 hypothetical protein AEK19_MT0798 [Utricularia reniformis]